MLALYWKIYTVIDDKRVAKQKTLPDIMEILDVPYIDDGTRVHKLDVYYPKNAEKPLPVIVDIHGGGWMFGYKEINRVYGNHLAKKGYTVFNLNYRLAPGVSNQEQLQDIAACLNWIYNNLDNYPCDRDNIYLTGDSAGGQLALYTAMLNTDGRLREIFEVQETKLDFNAVALTSPVSYLDKGYVRVYAEAAFGRLSDLKSGKYTSFDKIEDFGAMPPVFLVTSTGDGFGLEQTKRAYEQLRRMNVPAKLMSWPKTNGKNLHHVFSVLNPEWEVSQQTIDEMLAFFKKYESVSII